LEGGLRAQQIAASLLDWPLIAEGGRARSRMGARDLAARCWTQQANSLSPISKRSIWQKLAI